MKCPLHLAKMLFVGAFLLSAKGEIVKKNLK
jgi:hypothetical protein